MRHKITHEEKLAKKLYDIVNGLDIDLDMVGFYFARLSGKVHYKRIEIIYEAIKEEKEKPPLDYDSVLF